MLELLRALAGIGIDQERFSDARLQRERQHYLLTERQHKRRYESQVTSSQIDDLRDALSDNKSALQRLSLELAHLGWEQCLHRHPPLRVEVVRPAVPPRRPAPRNGPPTAARPPCVAP